jgi:hypothetical protein
MTVVQLFPTRARARFAACVPGLGRLTNVAQRQIGAVL